MLKANQQNRYQYVRHLNVRSNVHQQNVRQSVENWIQNLRLQFEKNIISFEANVVKMRQLILDAQFFLYLSKELE